MPPLDTPPNLEVLDHLPQGVFIVRRNGTVAFWNQCLEDWTGILKSTIVERPLADHFPHLGSPKYTLRFEPLFDGGPPATFASQFHPQFLPCTLPTGQPRIQQTMAKTLWDESSQEWQALIIIQDISDLHRQVAESQRLRKQAQEEITERQKHQRLLEAIRQIESTFISTKNTHQTFDEILTQFLAISESDYGFIGEVPHRDGKPYLKTHAITNIAWNEETREIFDRFAPNMEFFNLNTLFGRVLTTGEYIISNNPQTDTRRGGLPEGHPALNAFLGIPFFYGDQLVGMAGLGNRTQGYDSQLVEYLQPLFASCGKILHAFMSEQEREQTRTALRESEERLNTALQVTGGGAWDWNISSGTVVFSQSWYEYLGYNPFHFKAHVDSWKQLIHPDDLPLVMQSLQDHFSGRTPIYQCENRLLANDGTWKWNNDRGKVISWDEQGNPLRMVGTDIDISYIKEAEHALRESEERFKSLINSGPILMWTCLPDGQCDFLNAQWVEYTGIPEADQLGYNWLQQIHPDDQEHTKKDWEAAVESGRFFRTKFRLRHHQGQYRWFLTLANQIRDIDGQLLKWIGCNIDITAQLEVEEDMAQLHRAVDQGIEGLALLDQGGKYTYINRAHAEMYGYTVNDLLGQSWKILFSNDQLAFIDNHCLPHLRDSGNWQGELVGLRKDGTNFSVETSLSLLLQKDHRPAGLVCTCRDITERKEAEAVITRATRTLEKQNQELAVTRDEALAAAHSKAKFLASMSHEIRTPLNGVIGMTDLILATQLDGDQREMLNTVKHSGEFLLTIINDILDFSKIDAEKFELEEIDFDLPTTMDEVLEILTEQAKGKGLECLALIDAATPRTLRGDPNRIRQILINLIGNAIKFTEQGEIIVNVSLVREQPNATIIKFSVTDTGIGIPSAAQHRLFESFTQADSSTTRKFGGTGLGLAICKQLVTLMNGEIGVKNEAGHGSTFWFTIPFRHHSSSRISTAAYPSLHGHRLCIVETRAMNRFILQHYAESWGMTCEVAQTGTEGLALLRKRASQGQPFDVAILDQTISEKIQEDGLTLGKTIRQDSGLSQTLLILLTPFGQRGDAHVAQEAGFSGYLNKPIRHQHLQQCLQTVLSNRHYPTSRDNMASITEDMPSSALITRYTVEEAHTRAQIQILLTEDNLINQKVAVRMLKTLGYSVDVAVNGLEAVEAVGHTTYDLVLMDCHMPEMDGYEATRAIRESERKKGGGKGTALGEKERDASDSSRGPSHCSHVPIIALTANALPGDRETCLQACMDDFLTKPVRLEELSTMISKWLPHPTGSETMDHPVSEQTSNDSTHRPACIDERVLQNLKDLGGDDDPEFFITVLDQFLTDLPHHLENIKQAIELQDPEALVKAAHPCKGSCQSMGATRLAEMSYALEVMGREETMKKAPAKFEQWLQEQDRTIYALQQERGQLTSPSTPLS